MSSSVRRISVTVALCLVAVAILACTPAKTTVTVKPKVAPPAVKTAGVLVAGVDLEQPPFAGVDNSRTAGIDVDIASAVAGELGLKVEFVDVKPSEAATALADGTADIVLSVPYTDDAITEVTLAGSYISNVPGFFRATDSTAPVEPTETLASIEDTMVAAQNQSLAFWLARHEFGEEAVQEFPTLREALSALSEGQVSLVAGDALVAAYIARDFPNVHYVGPLSEPVSLGVAVASENTALADAVTKALDDLSAGGVLDTVRTKWVGDLAPLASTDSSGSAEASTTP